jgi:nucleolar protein 56
VFLVTEWFGTFLVEGSRVTASKPFPRDPLEVAQRLHALEAGQVLDEERALASGQQVQVAESRLLALEGARAAQGAPRLMDRAEEEGFSPELFRAALLELARRRAREAMAGRDQHVVQAVQAIDDLAETANQLAERLREWYGLHFPEADRLIERHEEMATLVSQHGTRDAILGASPHLTLDKESMGAELGDPEREALRGLARSLSSLYAQRAELDRYLEASMPSVAPNVTKLVGPAIAARLLFHAGGLQDLARMPSGTVQTLGAEKALFRHLKEGNRPPKHGVIFQHPLIHRAPFRQRGALSRALAGAISIAARADAFTGNDLAPELERHLQQRAEQLRSAPPKRRPMQPSKGRPPPSRGPPRGRPPDRRPPGKGFRGMPPRGGRR